MLFACDETQTFSSGGMVVVVVGLAVAVVDVLKCLRVRRVWWVPFGGAHKCVILGLRCSLCVGFGAGIYVVCLFSLVQTFCVSASAGAVAVDWLAGWSFRFLW